MRYKKRKEKFGHCPLHDFRFPTYGSHFPTTPTVTFQEYDSIHQS